MINRIVENIYRIKKLSPLVHNITNDVVMNNTANALLAAGASPIMAHAEEEINDMVSRCDAILINIGTPDRFTVPAMVAAIRKANELGKPIVLDPVGAGASQFRNKILAHILNAGIPQFIRGNASEIMFLAGSSPESKGVDSTESSANSTGAAEALSRHYGCIVSVSGQTDWVTNGKELWQLHNGSPMMTRVTGLGCTASALLAAFAAVETNPLIAAISSTAFMGICGEIAASKADGPGTLQLYLYDTMYNLTAGEVAAHLKIEKIK